MHQTSKRPEKRAAKLPRRLAQRERKSTFLWPFSKSLIPAYRKSILPEGKKAKPGRMM